MNAGADFNVSQILSNLYRRKGLIISVFVVVSLLAAYLATILPDIYRSSTVIVVTPQRLPASFVTSTVTMDLEERMQSIIQEILSVTQLDKIIQEFNLYPSDTKESNLRDRVEKLRKSIKVDFRRNNTRDAMAVFQLSFESGNPEKARQVTRRLATLFIDQNLQVREQQAMGTKAFMNSEVDRLRKELEQQETVVNQYKAGYLYELPDQLDTNLRTLEQLRRELEANNQRVSTLQERKGTLQKQSVESDVLKVDALGGSVVVQGDGVTQSVQLEVKKKELDSLLQRYSSRHPDVIRLQKEIQSLEAEIGNTSSSKTANSTKVSTVISPLKQVLQKQITDIDSEIQALRSQAESIRNQIGILQARVNNAPVRAIELSRVSRGYEITLKKYQDLLAKSLESELSENMEKSKKGEQFRILDPANLPLRPARPNRLMIVLAGLASGLAAGVALAFLWDNLDTSFKRGEEISAYVNLPVFVTIPALITRDSVLEQRRTQGFLVMASIGILAVGVVCVRILGPMYF